MASPASSISQDGPDFEPLGEYVDQRAKWLARCALLLTEDHEAALGLLQETMSDAWRYYDWVCAVEDPERYVLQILLNRFRLPDPAERTDERRRAVLVLRHWAGFDDRRIADLLGCRRSTVRNLTADAPLRPVLRA